VVVKTFGNVLQLWARILIAAARLEGPSFHKSQKEDRRTGEERENFKGAIEIRGNMSEVGPEQRTAAEFGYQGKDSIAKFRRSGGCTPRSWIIMRWGNDTTSFVSTFKREKSSRSIWPMREGRLK